MEEFAFNFSSVLKLVQTFGLPVIILVIWWFDHKRMNSIIGLTHDYRNLCSSYDKRAEEQDKDRREIKEALFILIGTTAKSEQKLADLNQLIVEKTRG